MYFLQAERTLFRAVELSETSEKVCSRQELVKNNTVKNLVDAVLEPNPEYKYALKNINICLRFYIFSL